MPNYYLLFIAPFSAFIFTLIITPIVRKIALNIGLTDQPNFRKKHMDNIPVIGGLVIFMATTLSLLFAMPFNREVLMFKNVFIGLLLMLIIGMIDDRIDIRASLKLAVELIIAHYLFLQGFRITSLQGIVGIYELADWAQYILTILVIVGVINAFNMIDGIDGLAGSMALFSFSIIIILSILTKQYYLSLILLTYVGALMGFLKFNFSTTQKIFLGDAGSLLLGILLVSSSIKMVQIAEHSIYITYIKVGVIAGLFVPVFDALRIFRLRLKAGKSPFFADRKHLHHLIIDLGISASKATQIIVVFAIIIFVVGLMSNTYFGITYATIFMLISFYSITTILQFKNKLHYWQEKIKQMEWNNDSSS